MAPPDLPIADTPDALTPSWLTEALRRSGLDVTVTRVTQQPVGTGQMCDSIRLVLDYARPGDAPSSIVAKLPAADETSRATALALRSYEAEVRFYQELASDLAIRTPAVHHADIDVETASFVLLLEDLAPARQGDQLLGCTAEEAEVALSELVHLHAARWADPGLPSLDWLDRDHEVGQQGLLMLLPMLWDGFRERYAADLPSSVHQVGDALFAALPSFILHDPDPWAVVHGDYRLDNLLFDHDAGTVAVVDWQTCSYGPALGDVAYFVGAGLPTELRRESEEQLVRGYHERLLAEGVSGYGWDRCFEDYRRGSFAGVVMCVAASMLVGRTERGDRMFLTMAERHAQHALDLDASDLL
jgi:aminoglycoside/choline kinase family phosphotransferase